MKRCAITGAAGHVGSAIARGFRADGWEVLAFGRRGVQYAQRVPYELGANPRQLPWDGIDALVHCAYDFRPHGWPKIHELNVKGSIALLRAAREYGVKHSVFISSLSAFPGCRSHYGQAKLEIEAAALELGCAVVRPGLVWSANYGSMLRALERASQAPVVPLIGDGSFPQYLVNDDELAGLVIALCQDATPHIPRAISAASSQKYSLRTLLQHLARRKGRSPLFVPIPWRLMYAGLKTLEALHLPAPFRSDSLLGIVFQNPAPQFGLPELPQIAFRPFV